MTDNRNQQRLARGLAAELGIKNTAALRIVRHEGLQRSAWRHQVRRSVPSAPGATAAVQTLLFLAPHPATTQDGLQ
ncbi:hypothetical protein SAMN05660209_03286 [Geodermatophilus africanus]|uniref:Uncharacterized protein n=1 Tax=Geodermatophilus africanus TaxID=1137993 RepID=A0A1H3LCG0_9ACTN|nr:hypothetical protein [Geodermatophilus africanus]SDY62092.1 hypothetical protein SAMN05660209_03286 [Geodermatophilus africanus]